MLSDQLRFKTKKRLMFVLILVLMEYALWQRATEINDPVLNVLILVLMEYALWQVIVLYLRLMPTAVLILVLMEYALWRNSIIYKWIYWYCLNPCSNGICSLTKTLASLNPLLYKVLILVLMEYALWQFKVCLIPL